MDDACRDCIVAEQGWCDSSCAHAGADGSHWYGTEPVFEEVDVHWCPSYDTGTFEEAGGDWYAFITIGQDHHSIGPLKVKSYQEACAEAETLLQRLRAGEEVDDE